MKKTALTFVAVAFGTCVAFAQTAPETEPQQNTEQTITVDKMSDRPEVAGRRTMKVGELPAPVQENLKGDKLKDFKVISVTEVHANDTSNPTAVQYEVALVEGGAATTDAEPSLIVFFDEKGKVVARQEAADQEVEE